MECISYPFYRDLITKTENILIAGMPGSGKSVILNGMVNSILIKSNTEHQMVLVDLKKVELTPFANTPHCIGCAETEREAVSILKRCLTLIDNRVEEMKKTRSRLYDGPTVHIIIDEMADLMLRNRECATLIQRIVQLGRAARIQVVCATQCPLSSVIPTPIKANFGLIIGLHTRNKQDSRNILDIAGCESLPKFGKALIRYANEVDIKEVDIPMVPEEELWKLVDFRIEQKKAMR